MGQPEEAREIHPWSRTFRNHDNETGPDYRPQFVEPEMPYAEDLDEQPYGGLTVEEEGAGEGPGGNQDPKGSTATVSVASLPPTASSQAVASPSSEEKTAAAGTVAPGAEVPGA
jgi:hypothetical protein